MSVGWDAATVARGPGLVSHLKEMSELMDRSGCNNGIVFDALIATAISASSSTLGLSTSARSANLHSGQQRRSQPPTLSTQTHTHRPRLSSHGTPPPPARRRPRRLTGRGPATHETTNDARTTADLCSFLTSSYQPRRPWKRSRARPASAAASAAAAAVPSAPVIPARAKSPAPPSMRHARHDGLAYLQQPSCGGHRGRPLNHL